MRTIDCAICEGRKNFEILYKASFDPQGINEKTFSARRVPDGCHYQIVRCKKCGLVYSNPIFEKEKIKRLYTKSKFTYETEVDNLRETYGHYLKKVSGLVREKGRLLELGCGNGFFLEEGRKQGYKEVWGVEPGVEAANKALPKIKRKIIVDFFQPGLFKKNFFDIICFFQTLDHIVDPNLFLNTCYEVLKKGGIIFCIVHNTDSFLNKVLGERSPIFDIEHIYLFNKKTLERIFEKNKFSVLEISEVINKYSLAYWVKMAPLPSNWKNILEKGVSFLKMQNLNMSIKAGNISIMAKKI